jgi:peptidoglycan/LPS O-acetylase OafA/YrhL
MSASTPSTRNQALDFTKGLLVVLMVVYHWINYFISTEGFYYRYLRFITPSFIFITGFLIAHAYLAKYDLRDARLPRRLLERGAKLLALFTLLNLAARLVVTKNYDGSELGVGNFLHNAVAIYLSGNGGGAVFQVLVPISYVLILSAVVLLFRRWFAFSVYGVCAGLTVAVLVADLCGLTSGNLELIGVGFLGVYFGSLGTARINGWLSRLPWVLAGYVGYLVAVSFWNVLYPLQIVGVCLSLLLIYALGSLWTGQGPVLARILLLGRYSLLAYIGQIVLLQILLKVLRPVEPGSTKLVLSFLGAMLLTQLLVEIMEWGRTRSKAADGLYRAVFA